MDLLWFLLIGLAAGWLASILVHGRGFGCLGDIAIGVLGAVVGGWVFGHLGIGVRGPAGFVAAVVGAVLLLAVIKIVKKV